MGKTEENAGKADEKEENADKPAINADPDTEGDIPEVGDDIPEVEVKAPGSEAEEGEVKTGSHKGTEAKIKTDIANINHQGYFYMEAFPTLLNDYLTIHSHIAVHDTSESDLRLQVCNYQFKISLKLFSMKKLLGEFHNNQKSTP